MTKIDEQIKSENDINITIVGRFPINCGSYDFICCVSIIFYFDLKKKKKKTIIEGNLIKLKDTSKRNNSGCSTRKSGHFTNNFIS